MEQLETSLALVAAGTTQLGLAEYPPDQYEEFQSLAEGIMQAKALGLIYEAKIERSRAHDTYGHAVRVVTAGGLTPSGKRWLQDAREHAERMKGIQERRAARTSASLAHPASPAKTEEIVQLRPAFMGVSIDLKALWRRLVAKRRE